MSAAKRAARAARDRKSQPGASRAASGPPSRHDALARCPYRAVIGLTSRVGHPEAVGITVIASGGEPEPFAEVVRAQVLATVRGGRSVLVAADRADLFDFAKADLIAILRDGGLPIDATLSPTNKH